MKTVPIVTLTRECQHVNEKWHRCGRLAYEAIRLRVGTHIQLSFRCRGHGGMLSNGQTSNTQVIKEVSPYTMNLGYKP